MLGKVIMNQVQEMINSKAPGVLEEVWKFIQENPPAPNEFGPSLHIDLNREPGKKEGEHLYTFKIKILYHDRDSMSISRVINHTDLNHTELSQLIDLFKK